MAASFRAIIPVGGGGDEADIGGVEMEGIDDGGDGGDGAEIMFGAMTADTAGAAAVVAAST